MKNINAVKLGKLGGSKTSPRKKLSSKRNGRLGGRPKATSHIDKEISKISTH